MSPMQSSQSVMPRLHLPPSMQMASAPNRMAAPAQQASAQPVAVGMGADGGGGGSSGHHGGGGGGNDGGGGGGGGIDDDLQARLDNLRKS